MQNNHHYVPSPSFRAVLEIAEYAGHGVTVARFEGVRFPTGTVQVWELTPHAPTPTDDDAALVIAVFLKGHGIQNWKPMPAGFEAAAAHYRRRAAQENDRRAKPVATGAEHAAVAA